MVEPEMERCLLRLEANLIPEFQTADIVKTHQERERQMAFIDDLKNAIDNYETNNCKTEIIDFSIINGGSVLNVGETFQFRVKVTNQSYLDMKSVKIQAIGSHYAEIASSPELDSFGNNAVSAAFNLDALQSHTTRFKGKAKAVTSGAKNIVFARIYSWDASLDHLLKDRTGAGVAEGKLLMAISPD